MNKLIDRANSAFVEFENLLIAEIVAGNTISGTPLAACGRVALGVACAMTRLLISKHSMRTAVAGGAVEQHAGA
jgi:hypothetical protein